MPSSGVALAIQPLSIKQVVVQAVGDVQIVGKHEDLPSVCPLTRSEFHPTMRTRVKNASQEHSCLNSCREEAGLRYGITSKGQQVLHAFTLEFGSTWRDLLYTSHG